MKNYIIYIHINKINKKVYIGQTCQLPNKRWNNGDGYKTSPHFYAAIQKYGWDNFEHKILENNLSQNEADQKEKFYIEKYNSTNPQKGYNILSGGNEKLSEYWSKEENRKRQSDIKIKYFKDNPDKKNLINKNRVKSVKCIETGEIFPSQASAARAYNINPGNLGKHLQGNKNYSYCGKDLKDNKLHWERINKEAQK